MGAPLNTYRGERGVGIHGAITDQTAQLCIAQLLYLCQVDAKSPIIVEINSPGGQVTPSLAIIRMMGELPCTVSTFCSGYAGGTATMILACGARGYRTARSNAAFALSPVYGGPDWNGLECELSQFDHTLVEILSASCGKHESEIYSLVNARSELSAPEALELGLIDSISDGPIIPLMPRPLHWRDGPLGLTALFRAFYRRLSR